MSEPIQECSIAEAKWLRKWVIVNPYNISERMEFDSVHDLAQHLFNSKELILNMVKERDALKAEVEHLRDCLGDAHAHNIKEEVKIEMCIARLKAEVERLRKAGDALYESKIGYYGEQILNDMKHHSGELCRNWLAAKEGEQP